MKTKLWNRKSIDFLETGISSANEVAPTVFGWEVCSGKKNEIVYDKDVYTIHFVVEGKGQVAGKTLEEGNVFLAKPHSRISYRPDAESPWVYAWFEFLGDNVEKYLSHCGFGNGCDILRLENLQPILEIFSRVFREVPRCLNHHAKRMLFIAACLELFSRITEECGYLAKNKEKSFQLVNYENIIRYVNSNYSNPDLTVASTAKTFSYAPSYLTRLFRKYSNMPPCKYITKVRMEKAVELMEKQQYSINQIASIVGYQSQFYFSKAFLQYYGVRPSAYRKQKPD